MPWRFLKALMCDRALVEAWTHANFEVSCVGCAVGRSVPTGGDRLDAVILATGG